MQLKFPDSTLPRVAGALAAFLLAGAVLVAPAAAGPKNVPTVTEDNDTNDEGTPEDVADEGDNAHPSGKDRSVENGNSTSNPNQGRAKSDPDDNGRGPDRSNRGVDQPGGAGGRDLADQDGNNGCGNDDDFEDDNEGWCGNKHVDEEPPPYEEPS